MKVNRTFAMHARAEEGEDHRIKIAISSETPVERFFGTEILSHAPEAVDLSRLADGRHPFLLGHDWDKQIGVIESAQVDDDRVLRGIVRFSRSPLGQEIEQDVRDEIRTLISVGYEILEVVVVEKTDEGEPAERRLTGDEFEREFREKYGEHFYRVGTASRRAGRSEPPTVTVTRWRPFEASVVPVPADTAVGVGRSAGTDAQPLHPERQVVINIHGGSAIPSPEEVVRAISAVADQGARLREKPDGEGEAGEGGERPPAIVQTSNREKPTVDTNQQLDAETKRRDAILDLGQQYAKYVTSDDVADHLRKGRSPEQFREFIMQKMEARHSNTDELKIGMERKEIQRYSIARAVAAAITGDWRQAGLELAASQAVAKMLNRTPEGFFVPFDVFHRDFNVGTASEAGNLVATDLRGDLFVDVLRNNLVLAQLGVRILVGLTADVDIPKKATASSLGMLSEIAQASETGPTTGKVSLTPKRMGAHIEYSKQALIQSALAIEPMLRDDLLQGAAVLLQDQVINGSGSGDNMTGIRNTSGIGSVVGGTDGAAITWDHIVDLESACANANAEPDRFSGYLINSKTRGKLKKTQKGTNLPFIWDNGDTPLNGYRAPVTNTMPSNLTKGTSTTVCSSLLFGSDWSMSVIGLFGAPDITVDPFTLAREGQVRITINQYADHGVRRAADFAKMDDALTS